MRKTVLLAAAALAASVVLGMPAPASALPMHVGPSEQAPECVTVVVLAVQADRSIARLHLEFCGNGPGGDSALHDSADGHRFVLDGSRQIGGDCGGWSDPCVIFPR